MKTKFFVLIALGVATTASQAFTIDFNSVGSSSIWNNRDSRYAFNG
jgi:hypothetical protein